MQKAAQQYMQTQVTTTTQSDLLIMLYDACIKFLKQSKEKMAVRDYAGKGILISKSMDILTELQSSLNIKVGGALAENLQRLYFYCNSRLLTANMKMDPVIIDEVIKIIAGVRDAYYQINNQNNQAGPKPQNKQSVQTPQVPHAPLLFPKSAPAAKPSSVAKPELVKPLTQTESVASQAVPEIDSQLSGMGPVVETESEQDMRLPEEVLAAKPVHRAFAAYAAANKPSSL